MNWKKLNYKVGDTVFYIVKFSTKECSSLHKARVLKAGTKYLEVITDTMRKIKFENKSVTAPITWSTYIIFKTEEEYANFSKDTNKENMKEKTALIKDINQNLQKLKLKDIKKIYENIEELIKCM